MAIAMRCKCGNVRGEVDLRRAYTRGTCYCRDCQAYARWLGGRGLVDACGGSDIVPMSPAGVRLTSGLEHLACMTLSDKGILRWYAACCRTPLGNTPRSARIAYLGLPTACLDATPEAIDASIGKRDRVVLNSGSATCPVASTPVAFVIGGLRILGNILAARLGERPPSPFFDADGLWIRTPQVLGADERAALHANAA